MLLAPAKLAKSAIIPALPDPPVPLKLQSPHPSANKIQPAAPNPPLIVKLPLHQSPMSHHPQDDLKIIISEEGWFYSGEDWDLGGVVEELD